MPSFLMSLAMPLSDGTSSFSTGARANSFVSAVMDGLTSTSPLIACPCISASRRARQPPIDRPITKTSPDLPRSSSKARLASAYQSSQRVRAISCQVVPCPGRRGSDTLRPASARYSAQPRSECGVPVKPWQSSTPVLDPAWLNDSAPGITGMANWSSPPVMRHLDRRTRPRRAGTHGVPVAGLRHTQTRSAVGPCERVLLGGQGVHRADPPDGLPSVGGGHRERAPGGGGHHREQPPVVFRPLLHPAAAAAQGRLPGEVRVLHRPR